MNYFTFKFVETFFFSHQPGSCALFTKQLHLAQASHTFHGAAKQSEFSCQSVSLSFTHCKAARNLFQSERTSSQISRWHLTGYLILWTMQSKLSPLFRVVSQSKHNYWCCLLCSPSSVFVLQPIVHCIEDHLTVVQTDALVQATYILPMIPDQHFSDFHWSLVVLQNCDSG